MDDRNENKGLPWKKESVDNGDGHRFFEKIKKYWLKFLVFILIWLILRWTLELWLSSLFITVIIFAVAKSFWEKGEFGLDEKLFKWLKRKKSN